VTATARGPAPAPSHDRARPRRPVRHRLAGLWANGFPEKLLAVLGALATTAGAIQFVLPHLTDDVPARRWAWILGATLLVALAAATVWAWPRSSIRYVHRRGGTWTVLVTRGDLFEAGVPIVVTVDRRATTDPKEVGGQSLVGVLVARWFGGDVAQLDAGLRPPRPTGTGTDQPLLSVGHTLAFGAGEAAGWLYCLADPTTEGHTTLGDVVTGHERLWSTLRTRNVGDVAVPVFGSGFARAQLSLDGLLSLLLLSFHAASLESAVVRTLRVYIHDDDFNPRVLVAAARMLEQLGYERA
jgi:hypothetical protein